MEPKPTTQDQVPLTQLLKQLGQQTGNLVRQEIELAKAETRESLGEMGRGIAFAAVGAALALAGLLLLLFVAVRGLTSLLAQFMSIEIAVWLAPLILAVLVFAGAGLLVRQGLQVIRGTSLAPRQTRDTLREDKEWIASRAHS